MIEQFTRALTGTRETPSLLLQRTYPTTAADLWNAITSPERVQRWLGSIEGCPQAAGDTCVVRPPDAADYAVQVRVVDCDAGRRLLLAWQPPQEQASRIEALLDGDGDGTRLTLTHTLQTTDVVGHGDAWEQCLVALSEVLGGDPSEATSIGANAIWRNLDERVLEMDWTLPAAPEVVWNAFTNADVLRTWWWNHWQGIEIDVDARPGGTYRFAAPDKGIAVEGDYLGVDEQRHLAFTWRWIDAEGTSRDEACDLRFEPVADGTQTRLLLRHTGPWSDATPADNYRMGWEFTVGALAGVLGSASSGPSQTD